MCSIEQILSDNYTADIGQAIEQLSNDDLHALFMQLGEDRSADNFNKIMAIAGVLYHRNKMAIVGTRLKDVVIIPAFIGKQTLEYVTFLRMVKPFRITAIAAYLFSGQDFQMIDNVLPGVRVWLDDESMCSWKEKVLLTCYEIEEINDRHHL